MTRCLQNAPEVLVDEEGYSIRPDDVVNATKTNRRDSFDSDSDFDGGKALAPVGGCEWNMRLAPVVQHVTCLYLRARVQDQEYQD